MVLFLFIKYMIYSLKVCSYSVSTLTMNFSSIIRASAHERNIGFKGAIYHSIRVLSIWWFCLVGICYTLRPMAMDLLLCDIWKSLFSITTISTQILANIPKARGNLNSRKLFVNDTFWIFLFLTWYSTLYSFKFRRIIFPRNALFITVVKISFYSFSWRI